MTVHTVPAVYKDDYLEDTIDSNVLWAFLSFCSRSQEQIDMLLSILKGQTIEFTKKCARLLQNYIYKPPEDPLRYLRGITNSERLIELK